MRDSSKNRTVNLRLASQQVRPLKKQAGMSFLGIFALVAMLVFVGLFAFKVGPSYAEYMTVSKIIDDTQANSEVLRGSKSKVLSHIGKAYRNNNLWDLKPEETVVLEKDGKRGFKIGVDYEKRANLFSNIYVVTAFKREAGSL